MQRLWAYLAGSRKRPAANRATNAQPKRRRTNTRPLGPTELVLAASRMFPRNARRVANLRAAVATNNLNHIKNAMAKLDAAAKTAQELRNLQTALRGYEAWHRAYAPKPKRLATFSNLPAHLVERHIEERLEPADKRAFETATLSPNAIRNRRIKELRTLVKAMLEYDEYAQTHGAFGGNDPNIETKKCFVALQRIAKRHGLRAEWVQEKGYLNRFLLKGTHFFVDMDETASGEPIFICEATMPDDCIAEVHVYFDDKVEFAELCERNWDVVTTRTHDMTADQLYRLIAKLLPPPTPWPCP